MYLKRLMAAVFESSESLFLLWLKMGMSVPFLHTRESTDSLDKSTAIIIYGCWLILPQHSCLHFIHRGGGSSSELGGRDTYAPRYAICQARARNKEVGLL